MSFRARLANTPFAASNACSASDFNKPSRRNLMNPLRTLAAALALIAPLAAQAIPTTNLITNGSFETYTGTTISSGQWTVVEGQNSTHGSKYLNGWQADATHGVELRNNVAGTAKAGNIFVELDSHWGYFTGNDKTTPCCNSWISQTVNTSLGQAYHLSYWYSPRAGSQSGNNQINVFWNGVKLGGGTYTNSGSGSGQSGNWTYWQQFEFDVVGTGNTGTLKFADAGTANTYGASLDNVSLVAAVPEPETYALMMAGLGAVAFMARRRRPK